MGCTSGLAGQWDENRAAGVREEVAKCILQGSWEVKMEIRIYKQRVKLSASSFLSEVLRLHQFKNLRRQHDD
jgi:hypothetical protein